MSFQKYYNKINDNLTEADRVWGGYESDEDVESLRYTISRLKDLFGEIEYNISSCLDYYETLYRDKEELENKLENVLDAANTTFSPFGGKGYLTLTAEQYFQLELNVPENQTFENTFGLRLFDTTISEKTYKQYLFIVLDEKKWTYNKIKHGI